MWGGLTCTELLGFHIVSMSLLVLIYHVAGGLGEVATSPLYKAVVNSKGVRGGLGVNEASV